MSRAVPLQPTAKSVQIKQANTSSKTVLSPDSLAQWQYPDGSGFGTQLVTLQFPGFPYEGLQGTTRDAIDKVYAFYREKATSGLSADSSFNWQTNTETTLLVNEPRAGGNTNGGIGFSAMATTRHTADNALMIVHQPTQTVIIKLSRDADSRDKTDISVVIDKR